MWGNMNTTATDLLSELTGMGVNLEAHGDKLRYRPIDAVSPRLLERMKANKPELLALLADKPEPLTHAQREIQRFLDVCVPYPDGCGVFDPAYADTIKALANVPLPQFMTNSVCEQKPSFERQKNDN